MRLLGDRILCKPIEVKQETEGGLILPSSIIEQNKFEVVMLGPKVKKLGVGDKVKIFNHATGIDFSYNERDIFIFRETIDVEFLI